MDHQAVALAEGLAVVALADQLVADQVVAIAVDQVVASALTVDQVAALALTVDQVAALAMDQVAALAIYLLEQLRDMAAAQVEHKAVVAVGQAVVGEAD